MKSKRVSIELKIIVMKFSQRRFYDDKKSARIRELDFRRALAIHTRARVDHVLDRARGA